jgi:hypothetical protein
MTIARGVAILAAGLLALPAPTRAQSATPDLCAQLAQTRAAEASSNAAMDARLEAVANAPGSPERAYSYAWYNRAVGEGKLWLFVRPDGSGTLSGSLPRPVEITAQAIRPIETAVEAAGFPAFRGVGDNYVCSDGATTRFVAASRGRKAEMFGNECGHFDAPLQDAVNHLFALAEKNGGVVQRSTWRGACTSPIQVIDGRDVKLQDPEPEKPKAKPSK